MEKQIDLNESEELVLRIISVAGENGKFLDISDISNISLLSIEQVSQCIDKLVEVGFIEGKEE